MNPRSTSVVSLCLGGRGDVDEQEFEEDSSCEEEVECDEEQEARAVDEDEEEGAVDEHEDFAELAKLCTRRFSRIAQAHQIRY